MVSKGSEVILQTSLGNMKPLPDAVANGSSYNFADAKAILTDRFDAPDADQAKAKAKAHKTSADREKGGGTIVMNGTTTPQPEANVTLIGARPGIGGTYRIDTVTHQFDGNGWTTRLEVKQPQGEAGKDSRDKTTGSTGKAYGTEPSIEAGAVPNSDVA